MNKVKKAKGLGIFMIIAGVLAFGFEFLCDQNYLPYREFLGHNHLLCFSGLSLCVMGMGISEWARLRMLRFRNLVS